MKVPVSVIVITKDEEKNIRDCLGSVSWADEIIVVDAASEDRTVELAREFTDKVFVVEWLGFAESKSLALQHTSHEWVLWLDADERVPPALADEITEVASVVDPPDSAWRMARRSFFLGKWIRHCGWYPGHVTRLFRKSHARFSDSKVHEYLIVDGSTGTLRNDLYHYTDDDLSHYYTKFNRYTTLAAGELLTKGKKVTVSDLVVRPWLMFIKMYILKAGFLDGVHGLLLCRLSASYVLAKYSKVWETQQRTTSKDEASDSVERSTDKEGA